MLQEFFAIRLLANQSNIAQANDFMLMASYNYSLMIFEIPGEWNDAGFSYQRCPLCP